MNQPRRKPSQISGTSRTYRNYDPVRRRPLPDVRRANRLVRPGGPSRYAKLRQNRATVAAGRRVLMRGVIRGLARSTLGRAEIAKTALDLFNYRFIQGRRQYPQLPLTGYTLQCGKMAGTMGTSPNCGFVGLINVVGDDLVANATGRPSAVGFWGPKIAPYITAGFGYYEYIGLATRTVLAGPPVAVTGPKLWPNPYPAQALKPGMGRIAPDAYPDPWALPKVQPLPWRLIPYAPDVVPYAPYRTVSGNFPPFGSERPVSSQGPIAGTGGWPAKGGSPNTPAPPGPGTKERKIQAPKSFGQIAYRVMEGITESKDLLEALLEGFPKKMLNRWRADVKHRTGRWPTAWEYVDFIYEHWENFNVGMAVQAVIANQVEDALIGRLQAGAKQSQLNQVLQELFGHGFSIGPAL